MMALVLLLPVACVIFDVSGLGADDEFVLVFHFIVHLMKLAPLLMLQ